MKASRKTISILILLGAWVGGVQQSSRCEESRNEPGTEHVILISIDGFARYQYDDPRLRIPNIRELASRGVCADRSETVFPSVTHPSHTTILTGCMPQKHGIVGNNVFNRATGEKFHVTDKPKTEMVKVPTLLDLAKKKGLVTASLYWPETYKDPSSDYNIPEVFIDDGAEVLKTATPASLPQELRDNDIPIDIYTTHKSSISKAYRDEILTQAAAYVFKTYKPNLLVIHILATDSWQHKYGPHGYGARFALEVSDECVEILREAVDEAGLESKTTFVVCSDHGFLEIRRELRPLIVLKEAGLLDKVKVHGGGFYRMLNFDPSIDKGQLEKCLKEISELDGMQRIVRPEEYHALGLPEPDESAYVGDVILVPEPDVQISTSTEPPLLKHREQVAGAHGFFPDHPDLWTLAIFSGAGIQRGASLGTMHNADIAPTIARLLDLDIGDVDGRVLTEVLK